MNLLKAAEDLGLAFANNEPTILVDCASNASLFWMKLDSWAWFIESYLVDWGSIRSSSIILRFGVCSVI